MSEIVIEPYDENEFSEECAREIECRFEDLDKPERWISLPDWVETAEDFAKWVDSIQVERAKK